MGFFFPRQDNLIERLFLSQAVLNSFFLAECMMIDVFLYFHLISVLDRSWKRGGSCGPGEAMGYAMFPLQRPRAPPSIHSWWSDSNPGGAAFPLHTLAKPLAKLLHHRAVSSIIAKSRSGPLSKGNLEALTWYLQ